MKQNVNIKDLVNSLYVGKVGDARVFCGDDGALYSATNGVYAQIETRETESDVYFIDADKETSQDIANYASVRL